MRLWATVLYPAVQEIRTIEEKTVIIVLHVAQERSGKMKAHEGTYDYARHMFTQERSLERLGIEIPVVIYKKYRPLRKVITMYRRWKSK